MVQFKLREIVLIFVMLVLVTSAVFGLGIFLGHEFQQVEEQVVRRVDLETLPVAEPEIGNRVEEAPSAEADLKEKPADPVLKPLRGFTIQVALLEDEETARTEKERIEVLGFPSVFIREAKLDDRKWYFVDVGYFKEKSGAEKLASRLLEKGMVASYLIRKTGLDPSDETTQ